MNVTGSHDTDRSILLGRGIDDLLLQLRGLVLVRELLAERGATRAEVDAHTDELERVRNQLIGMIGGGTSDHAYGEAA
jgi:hypothetical protein